jgi:hypothetical protein
MNEQFTPEISGDTKGMKDTVRDAKEKLKASTKAAASQARDRGMEFVEHNRTRTADRLNRVCERMRETADRFEKDDDDADIAHYTRMIAGKLDGAASYVRQHDFQQLRHDAEDLARRHPAIFFGGMFVLGMAAARFLKASAARAQTIEPAGDDTEDIAAAPSQPYSGTTTY